MLVLTLFAQIEHEHHPGTSCYNSISYQVVSEQEAVDVVREEVLEVERLKRIGYVLSYELQPVLQTISEN